MIASTITIPCYTQPNFLHVTLHALLANSFYKHRILVLYSDPRRVAFEHKEDLADDWEFLDGSFGKPYTSVEHFVREHGPWFMEHGVEFLDVTEEEIPFTQAYARGEIFPNKTRPQGGVDIAFKNNVGLRLTTTEWTIPNWDCDFYPEKHWDRSIFEYALSGPHPKEFLVPMHVQPQHVSPEEIDTWDAWRDSARFSSHRLTLPTTKHPALTLKEGPWSRTCLVTEEEFQAFANRTRHPGQKLRERPGDRQRLHWVPWILRADDIRDAGGFHYQGAGYDIEFDDRLGRLGFQKIGFCDAFIMHKGFSPLVPGRCPFR